MRSRLQVIFLGIVSLLLYLFLAKISTEFNWGEGYADRPILTYLGIYFSLSLLFFATCSILLKQPNDRFIFWAMIAFGLLFRFSILSAQQIQEDDVYRYLWDGKVFSNNINPFEYSPSEVHNFKELRIQNPETYYEVYNERNERELEQLAELKWESPRSIKFLERVNHPSVPTIYPPMAQYVFRTVHFFQPDSILAMRLAFLIFDVLALFFIIGILGNLGLNINMSGVYFWCPLIIKETFNSTHLDIIGISFLCGSIYFLVHKRHTLAAFFLALGFLGKLYPAILFPLYIQACFQQGKKSEKNPWRIPILNTLFFVGIIILGYIPFMGIGLHMFDGLKAYSLYWQSNDSIFACFLFLFKSLPGDLSSITFLSNSLPVFLSKVTVVCILMGVLIWLLLKNTPLAKDPQVFLKQFFMLMALVFLLSPIQNPWYLCWVVPFLCLFPSRSWILLTGLVGLYYLDFYFDYQEIQSWSQWVSWVEYLPFYLLLIWDFRNTKKILKKNEGKQIQ
jgi:alpha-1,6-mannosyltransferase